MSIKKNPSLAGVVILYHPENDVVRNISSYIGQLDKLYVVDNSEKKNEILKKKIISNWGKKIHYCENVVNEGIAKPINTIARQAIIDGYAYLLTMDQDSAFKENTDFSKAILCIENNKRIALFNFNHHYKEFFRKRHKKKWIPIKYLYMLKEYICIKLASKESFLFSKTYEVITSGTIMNLSVFQEIGNMDENLFIDEVDHEYSLRAVKKVFCYENTLTVSPPFYRRFCYDLPKVFFIYYQKEKKNS